MRQPHATWYQKLNHSYAHRSCYKATCLSASRQHGRSRSISECRMPTRIIERGVMDGYPILEGAEVKYSIWVHLEHSMP